MIEFQNVDLVFGKKPERALPLLDKGYDREQLLDETGLVLGVRDANLKIEKGEICVLMGLSGSGKSSLIRCVNGLNRITRGKVLIEHEGKSLNFFEANAETQRAFCMKRIAMVFQKFALMPWLTVAENVAFALDIQKLPKAEIKRRVDEQLALVGLTEWRDHKPSALSGGMQQRVGLARALATESDILLMDEPFSALDPLIRQQLQEELLELQSRLQKTIIFVSHDLDEALKLGNTIAIMKDGCIVQQGKPHEIVLSPATPYVEDFVAHTNPLNVLRVQDVCRPMAGQGGNAEPVPIDALAQYSVDPEQSQLLHQGKPVDWQRWETLTSPDDLSSKPTLVSPECGFRDAMRIRQVTGYPVLVEWPDAPCQIVTDELFYQGLLGRHEASTQGS